MALRALMLKKQLDNKRKAYQALLDMDADFESRNAELEKAIDEAETEDEQNVVREAIEAYESEKAEHEAAKASLDEEIRGLEADLDAIEAEDQAEPTPDLEPAPAPAPVEERKEHKAMNTRKFFGMNAQERDAFIANEGVQHFLSEVRTCIREKRALTNVGLLVPEVMLGLIRENIEEFSKLYKYVNVKPVSGTGRAVVEGSIAEAVWTECCANLNELDLGFNDVEVGCWRVAGYFSVCNANVEDSDIDLAAELIRAIGAGIGIALDKAILYGTGTRMPLGVVTRLAQTEAPADYPATARTWVDLHTTNIKSIAASKTGVELFKEIIKAFSAAKGKYSIGGKVFIVNETTKAALQAEGLSINAAGAIVSGINDTMPIIGGDLVELDFIPDNVIIGGYFDLYLLAERAGAKFATSEHVKFLEDKTVFRGVARYDGKPAIAEGFAAVGIGGTTPNANMTFAADTANE